MCFFEAGILITTRTDLASRVYVTGYFVLWAIFFLLFRTLYGFETREALPGLVILGLILPGISLLATRRVPTLPYHVLRPALESAIFVAYLAVVTGVLVWGFPGVARITTEPLHSVMVLGLSLRHLLLFLERYFWPQGTRSTSSLQFH